MEENSGRSFARSTKALYLCKIEGKDMSEGHQLIVTINNHPVFGPLLIPYLARSFAGCARGGGESYIYTRKPLVYG